MQTYLKTKPAGVQLLLFMGLAMGIFAIVSFAGVTLLSAATGIDTLALANAKAWKPENTHLSLFVRGMLLVQFLGLFGFPCLLFAYFSDPNPKAYLGLQQPFQPNYFALGIALLLVSFPLVEALGWLNQKMNLGGDLQAWMKQMESDAGRQVQFLTGRHTVKELLLNLFFIAVLAGVGEELFFRGVLQRLFIRLTRSPWLGIVLTAALFSGFHLQFFGFFPRFLLGILLGAMYWYSGSLWVSIVAHFFYDALLVFVLYANPGISKDPTATLIDPAVMWVPAAISALLVAVLLYRMKRQSKASFDEVYADDFSSPSPFSF